MPNGTRGTVAGIVWSVDYDGKSVFDLMEQWDKMLSLTLRWLSLMKVVSLMTKASFTVVLQPRRLE